MLKSMLRFGLILSAMVAASPASAQTGTSEDQSVDLNQVRQFRTQTERNASLTDDVRSSVIEYCDVAISSLETAADNKAATVAFERERSGVDRLVRNLRADLEKPESLPHFDRPESYTVAQVEDALARERARLAAKRAVLRDQERLAEDRAKSRTEISQRLGELDLVLELLNDELRTPTDGSSRKELRDAARWSILGRRVAAMAEVEMLRAQLALLVDRSILIPLNIDLARRRVSFSQGLLAMLEEVAHEVRGQQAEESLEKIRLQSAEISRQLPALADLTAETEAMAEELWSLDGVVASSEEVAAALASTRSNQSDLKRIAELAHRKFEAYGHRGSITRWWPDFPDDFPEPGAVANTIRHLDEEIPEVEHRLITYEQKRSAAHELVRKTMLDLQEETGDELDPDLVQDVRDLLSVRQDILDQLIQQGGRYSNQLAEYRTVLGNFLTLLHKVERFLYSHILWARSVPRPIIPQLGDMVEAVKWLVSPENVRTASIVGFKFTGDGLIAALLLIGMIVFRQPLRRRLREVAQPISDPEKDGLRYTIGAVVITVLLAAPLPLAFLIVGSVLNHAGDSTYLMSASKAMFQLAVVAGLFEFIRQISAPYGLAEVHFAWQPQATRPLYRGILLTEIVSLPLLYIALQFGFAGMRLDSPDQLQVFNNSLGRVAFIAALAFFGLTILATLRPVRHSEPSDQSVRVPWPKRFSEYAFPTVFLGAYPIIIFVTVVPAVMAVLGFYVTGMLLAYQMLRTLILAFMVLIAGGLIHRGRIVGRNRALLAGEVDLDQGSQNTALIAAEKQMRQLLRFGIATVLAIGLFGIWSDALPWLQVLKRVQILPRVELLEDKGEGAAVLEGIAAPTESQTRPAADSENTESATNLSIPGTGAGEAASDDSSTVDSTSLTLWRLFEAMLVGIATLILVKNLPSVLEILLKRRTTLDGGARFAISALIRYLITIGGTIAVFGLLGITWTNVQWLAAALTFGLGFGLQEIVANFVSGLILLIERPIRVGDVVTIGTLMGRVTRIQIRATTITLWDRSEMIVPNKEFITTKLVNWTLSDSKRRIEIPLRVAYGADLNQIREILVDIADQHPSVLADPPPHTLLLGFGDDAINFELRFIVDFGQGLTTKDEVQMSIERVFREHGINFALPKSEMRLISDAKSGSDEALTGD